MAGIRAETAEDDIRQYLTAYVAEMTFSAEDPGTVVDRYHTPDLEWVNDGTMLDRAKLVAHARPSRRNVTSCRVEVHEAFGAGDRVAARYTLVATTRKGVEITTDVHWFADLAADGRIRRVHTITRTR
ncbi:nuclear transport factor 2 family protein [Actinocatenispora rupis]|uniref:SnoaL-like domain-containing protein n=1 Tax=Actinocatenispora rupis TaxID=519421 RepID=A0A8J3J667_9ACTN|nr:nuclear transport factor 2 family protein [Actinocatenispora rupis]GID12677.1 hypothetical protein Aru02nite_35660 [Actinocatenispora rupis]